MPASEEIERVIAQGTEKGLAALKADLSRQVGIAGKLVEQDWKAQGLVKRR